MKAEKWMKTVRNITETGHDEELIGMTGDLISMHAASAPADSVRRILRRIAECPAATLAGVKAKASAYLLVEDEALAGSLAADIAAIAG